MTEEITPLFPPKEIPENTLVVDKPTADVPYYCDHPTLRIDGHRRLLYCGKCNATLDPFDFLRDNANHLATAWRDYKSVRDKLGDLSERVHNLAKEEKRLKARVKTLQDKTGGLIVIRGKQTL